MYRSVPVRRSRVSVGTGCCRQPAPPPPAAVVSLRRHHVAAPVQPLALMKRTGRSLQMAHPEALFPANGWLGGTAASGPVGAAQRPLERRPHSALTHSHLPSSA